MPIEPGSVYDEFCTQPYPVCLAEKKRGRLLVVLRGGDTIMRMAWKRLRPAYELLWREVSPTVWLDRDGRQPPLSEELRQRRVAVELVECLHDLSLLVLDADTTCTQRRACELP